MAERQRSTADFPVGFDEELHPEFSINFQMNRFYSWTNDSEMLEELRSAAPDIHSYAELIEIYLKLGQQAVAADKKLKAANYLRGAEFYMPEDHPLKHTSRQQFIALARTHYHVEDKQHFDISYGKGFLSAYRFAPQAPAKGSIVLFGGFDSYIEEILLMALVFKDAGYDVVCFDGPGQGAALEDWHLPMTHEWEKPVTTVLDFFNLKEVTLIGLSLGGCLALRAAAYENNRIKRVVADDICADFYKVLLRQTGPLEDSISTLMVQENEAEINALFSRLMKQNLMLEWGIRQGMHVTGSQTPYGFLKQSMLYTTAEISPLLSQDVLLLAGQEDHYIPLVQFGEQISSLTSVRSLATRLFTRKEQAQNHCHVGNIGLSINVILNWLQQLEE
ncbi:alpha/beta hydrolase [Paenibacillus graminis]|uniref:Alpha/beta hydrolase n=1 Tax=Paenibacillus graminis TaxID=189425 RepID=A0A089M8U4_9BACL|nr:alpha/beta hydrolase [Paenibacillus graminis]AIQ69682.1 alpha/beta hydrolase [Paenibacillus graminis]